MTKIEKLKKLQKLVNTPEFKTFHNQYMDILTELEIALDDGYDLAMIVEDTVHYDDAEDCPNTLAYLIKEEKEDQ